MDQSSVGLAFTVIGTGMEIARPALRRRIASVPAWVDSILGFGGLGVIGFGLYLLSQAFFSRLSISLSGQYATPSPWFGATTFLGLAFMMIWGTLRIAQLLEQRPICDTAETIRFVTSTFK